MMLNVARKKAAERNADLIGQSGMRHAPSDIGGGAKDFFCNCTIFLNISNSFCSLFGRDIG